MPEGGPNRHNPIREFFIMVIQHQNYHWGQLRTVARLYSKEQIPPE